MTGKEFLIKQLAPMVLPHLQPVEQKAVELIEGIELKEGENQIISILQIKDNEIHALLFAIDGNYKLLRQIEIDGKKSFKINELIKNALTSF